MFKERRFSEGKDGDLTVDGRNVVANESNPEIGGANATDDIAVNPTVASSETPRPTIKDNNSDSLGHSGGVTRVEDRRGSATITEDFSIGEDSKPLGVARGDQQGEQQLPETYVASVRPSLTNVTSGLDGTSNENELESSRTSPLAEGKKNVNSSHQLRRSLEEDSVPSVSVGNTTHQTGDPVPARTGDAHLARQEEESLEDSAPSALSVNEDSTVPTAAEASKLAHQDENSNPVPHTVEQPAEGDRDVTVDDESTRERICSLAATVAVPLEYDALNGNNVTLSGSVFRVPNANPKYVAPGKRFGLITGQIAATPIGSETGENIATIRGALFSPDENAASGGQIAHASFDVVSCSTGERVAIITADVYPDSACPDESSAVITGDVIALSQNGSADQPIGTVEGRVVALVFKEGVFEFSSEEE